MAQRVGRRRPGDGLAWDLPPVPVGARHRRCPACGIPWRTTWARPPSPAPWVGRCSGAWTASCPSSESLPEPEIDDVELNAYLLLTYAHFIAEHLPNKQQARFRGALEVVRADLTARLGLTDTGEPPDPARLRTLSKSTALMPLLGVAMTNPVAPYDSAISAAARRDALHDLAVWIGLYSGYGRTLQRALTQASMAIAPTWVDRMWLRPRRPRSPRRLDAVELTAIRLVAAELARQREGLDSDPRVYRRAGPRRERDAARSRPALAVLRPPRARDSTPRPASPHPDPGDPHAGPEGSRTDLTRRSAATQPVGVETCLHPSSDQSRRPAGGGMGRPLRGGLTHSVKQHVPAHHAAGLAALSG